MIALGEKAISLIMEILITLLMELAEVIAFSIMSQTMGNTMLLVTLLIPMERESNLDCQ